MADWTETFFTGLWSILQRKTFTPAESEEQARFVRRVLGLRRGSRALDVPCGDGRIAFELARVGVSVVGVDACAPSIRRARRRFREQGLPGRFHVGDMRELKLPERFHAVLNWWGSFGYYDDETNLDILAGFVEHLLPGGRVLIHQVNRERVLREFRHRMSADYGGVRIETRNRWDPVSQRIEGRWTISSGRRREKRRSSMRIYTRAQMARLMRTAGLGGIHVYGDTDGRPYDRGTRWMAAVGRKP